MKLAVQQPLAQRQHDSKATDITRFQTRFQSQVDLELEDQSKQKVKWSGLLSSGKSPLDQCLHKKTENLEIFLFPLSTL